MTLPDRVQALKDKHAALDLAIDNETRRSLTDSAVIKEMKLQKLAIKDELDRLTKD